MLIHTMCPIDDSDDSDVELYPANFKVEDLSSDVFSARRSPDRIHYRMVRNTKTGSLRADPILDDATVRSLYTECTLTDELTWEYAAITYRAYLERVLPHIPSKLGLLEIGCGHGPFLTLVKNLGFERVVGVEPSVDSVSKALPDVQDNIQQGFLETIDCPSESFSLICGFHVLDHLSNPNHALAIVRDLLVTNGIVYFICHDVGAVLARLLGRRSPIIDIEHPVLYDRITIAKLLQKHGFEVVEQFGVTNSYSMDYWLHLAPLPSFAKSTCRRILKHSNLGHHVVSLKAGNMGVVARKV